MPSIMPIPQYRSQTRVSGAGSVGRARNPEAEAAPFHLLAQVIDEWTQRRTAAETSRLSNEARNSVRAIEREEGEVPADQATEPYSKRVETRLKKLRDETINQASLKSSKVVLRQWFDAIEGASLDRAATREAVQRQVIIGTELNRAITAGASAAEHDPYESEQILTEIYSGIDAQPMDDANRAEWKSRAHRSVMMGGERGFARVMPAETLKRLQAPDPRLDQLDFADRDTIRQHAEDSLETGEANRILNLYRDNVRTGDSALAELEGSELSSERLDGIRRRVQGGVSLMRNERASEYLNQVTQLESRIATGAEPDAVFTEIDTMYRVGAISPAQYSSFNERAAINAEATAKARAAQAELAAAVQSGMPLDPSDHDHKQFLEQAFGEEVRGVPMGTPEWQLRAQGYAGRFRVLPPQASSWLRSAARSPSPSIVVAGAEFYGALELQSPEAASDVDTDSKAMLAQVASMIEAGAKPGAAFEAARANTFEIKREVREARASAFKTHAKDSASSLGSYIDRDFDTAFTKQPEASVALQADFDRQTEAYFTKVGDITLARDLAWRDLRRVYGVTEVNGERMVTAFPVERFGLAPADVRRDIDAYLRKSGQDLKAEDVLVVPDSLTLRSAYDGISGKPVMPSYRLVTKTGDLVLDVDGVPVRYSLPTGEELTRRVHERQEHARQDAAQAVQAARERRARMQAVQEYRRKAPK
ncbi:MAG: hypothetical protein WD944_06505 [Steroidobacteraceae bacterium]